MSVFWIAWKSIKHRGFASILTILSMMLGVMLVVCVLTIHGVVERSFSNNGEVGYDVLIGAKGGDLDLALNSVYYLSKPVETIPYEYYLACKDQEFRQQEFMRSLHVRAHRSRAMMDEVLRANMELAGLGGPISLATELTFDADENQTLEATGMFEDGVFYRRSYVAKAIPILLGDYFDDYRVVATVPEFFDDRVFGQVDEPDEDEDGEVIESDSDEELEKVSFEFADGQCFEAFSKENGFMECVLGWRVAKETKTKVGDTIQITHGVPASKGGGDALHEQLFKVVGILARRNQPEDRVAFVNMDGFFLMNDHQNKLMTEEQEEAEFEEKGDAAFANRFDSQLVPLPLEQRRVSAILTFSTLVGGVNCYAPSIRRQVNKGTLEETTDWSDFPPPRLQKAASAIFPIAEINKLFVSIVTPIQTVLLVLTFMICVVSGISILVSIYNSMSDRRQEIAVMRALGANRGNIMTIILVESSMLAIFGLALGWLAGHALIAASSPYVDAYAGVSVGFMDFASPIGRYVNLSPESLLSWLPNFSAEFYLLPAIMFLAIAAGMIPAIVAYRTDVGQNLGK